MSKINRHPVRRTAAGVLASALVLSGAVAAATPASAAAGFALERLQGNDRYETSAAVAAAFGAATNVIIASGESGRTPDALAASFLAGVQNAPVVLTRRDTTPEPILAALRTLRTGGATTLTVVGGTAAVSDAQLTSLRALGFTTVNRVAGADRYQTAAAVVAAGEGATASNVGLVASGVSTIDALAGGPLSFKGRHPMFLVTRDGIPGATLTAMRAAGVTSVYVLGGEAVVGPRVVEQLSGAGITLTGRLAGADRSATSVAIARAIVGGSFGFTNTTFNVASGANEGIDALSGAALSGKQNRPILVTNTAGSAAPVEEFARTNAATLNAAGVIFGGVAAVTQALEERIEAAGGTGPVAPGAISLGATSAVQGGSFTGTVTDPGTIQNISLTGCGFNNESITVNSAGSFTRTLPASQTAGSCTLTFTVLRTDGTSSSQTINFAVTAAQASTTGAPDLTSASANTTSGVVTYTFDENVTGAAPDIADFYLYNAAGDVLEPRAGSTASAVGSTVLVQFEPADAAAATLAAINAGGVEDGTGIPNYAASAPLGVQTQAAGVTNGPDLQSVNALRVVGGDVVADFTFDEATDAVVGDLATAFQLIAADGDPFNGVAVTAVSVDRRTVTVSFDPAAEDVPQGSIVRGVAGEDAVADADGNGNTTQTEPRTGAPAFTTGATADRTDDPDLLSVAVAGTDTVTYRFDEPVAAGTLSAADFYVYNSTGDIVTAATGATAPVRTSDTSIVNVTFAAGTVATAVGAGVTPGAVSSVDNASQNVTHEAPLQAVSNTAGRTALPDLVSVAIEFDEFGENTVAYTFDEALGADETEALAVAAANAFGLVDAAGVRFAPTAAAPEVSTDERTLTFVFTNAQAAAAVIGNVQDAAADDDLTTGDVTVQRAAANPTTPATPAPTTP